MTENGRLTARLFTTLRVTSVRFILNPSAVQDKLREGSDFNRVIHSVYPLGELECVFLPNTNLEFLPGFLRSCANQISCRSGQLSRR